MFLGTLLLAAQTFPQNRRYLSTVQKKVKEVCEPDGGHLADRALQSVYYDDTQLLQTYWSLLLLPFPRPPLASAMLFTYLQHESPLLNQCALLLIAKVGQVPAGQS